MFYRVDAECVRAVGLELQQRILQILVDGRVVLVQVGQVHQREVLQHIGIVEVGVGGVGKENTARVRSEGCEWHSRVQQRAHFAGIIGIAVVGGEIHDHADSVLMGGG